MKPSKTTKRRRFGNKKTRRIKRRGGMMNAKERAAAYAKMREKARATESEAAHAVLTKITSPSVRKMVLTTGSALADHVAGQMFVENPMMSLHGNADKVLSSARPHKSFPALFQADDMFQQAEQMCSMVKGLPDTEMWTRSEWGAMNCSPMAKSMCAEAVKLYKDAINLKYLPAYAPLAWMMSYRHPDESLRLCDECIEDPSSASFAKKAKTDCTALRAYLQYEHDMKLQTAIEMETPFPGGHMEEVPAMKAPPIEELRELAKKSISEGSKYGHALEWLLLTYADGTTHADTDTVQRRAEGMGLDFQRCRFCVD